MSSRLRRIVNTAAGSLGYTIQREHEQPAPPADEYPPDFSAEEREICRFVAPYTMTSSERIVSLVRAVQYLEQYGIGGAIVECGVWRGGSMMAVAKTLLARGSPTRDLFLFDTYSGMPDAAAVDVDVYGRSGAALLEESRKQSPEQKSENDVLAECPLGVVRANLASSGYPTELLHYVEGRVEDTIPRDAPQEIALLRLDTDWYKSTRHELEHLFPRVVRHGVLVIDDYGYWGGARRAVDEYFAGRHEPVFLNRVDFTARIAIR